MEKIRLFNLPNALTCCNLISGCIAICYAVTYDMEMALLWIVAGAVFDFFDGFSARLTHVSSPIGKELDSLADVVTFGVAPSAIVAMMLVCVVPESMPLLPFAAFIMAAFSALRLAKFNLDTRQTTSFIGLPTPANALFWASLACGYGGWLAEMPGMATTVALLVGMMLMSFLLISEIPMFALKFKHYGWRGNEMRYLLLIFSVVLIVLLREKALVWAIALYILMSIINNSIEKSRKV